VRPHDFHLAPQPQGPEAIATQIVRIYGAGPWLRLELRREADGQLLEVEVPRGTAESGELAIGTRVYAHPRRTRVFLEAVEGEALR
jgi:sulfate transport system ATP-binding protein